MNRIHAFEILCYALTVLFLADMIFCGAGTLASGMAKKTK
jgi:hypothetical protein